MLCVTEIDQRIEPGHRLEHDIAALASVSTVGAAEFDELFATKTDRTWASGSGTNENLGLIKEMHDTGRLSDAGEKRKRRRCTWRTIMAANVPDWAERRCFSSVSLER
jgi:hypothetical protein